MAPGRPRRLGWAPHSLGLLAVTYVLGALFATGVASAPHSATETIVYDVVLFNAVPLAAAAVSLRAARRVPAERLPWRALALTWLLSVAGNTAFSFSPTPAFPSLADVCYLAAYPLIAAAALGLVHVRGARLRPSAWLDGAVAALGVTACAVTFLIAPSLDLAGLELSATTLTYPVADVLLLALLSAVMAVVGLQGDRGLVLLAGAMLCKVAGDVLFSRAEALDGYVVGGPVDLTWIAACLLGATGAHLARPQRDADRADEGLHARIGWRVMAIPLTCTVGSLVVLGLDWGDGTVSVGEVAALGCLIMSLARTAVTFHEVRSLQEVRRQAWTDDLTGLPNRRALLRRLDQVLAGDRRAALLLLDLDGFKAVNDGLGHAAGDELLRRLAERFREAVRPGDLVARLGGDEFAVLLPDATSADAHQCARRVHELACRPVDLDGVSTRVGASVGIAGAPDQAGTVAELLHHADVAMYAAKARRGGVRWYAPGDADAGTPDAAQAPGGDGSLLFRPWQGSGDRVLAAAALVRTDASLPLAPAGVALLDDTLRAVAGWWEAAPVPAVVTVTAADVTTSRVPDRIAAALLRAGLPAGALVVSLDRDALLAHPDEVPPLLSALQARGISSAVPALGTGALALVTLQDLPADRVLLDRALTRDVVRNRRANLVVAHTVALAKALGSTVLAESVDEHSDAALTRLGCEVLRPTAPLPPEEFARRLRRSDPVPPSPVAG
ncbi:MAG TPA: diguanylate cyclase [Blastococcus sp.]|nr:diguanylate cyclase [Blastococcus sp.]